VSLFVPKDHRALRSYQKHEGKDELDVKDSLPIALHLFSIESTAETLDAWLIEIIESESDLTKYVNLVMQRQKGNLSARMLQTVASWFLESESKLLEIDHQILHTALKLLLTTTVLNLVPKLACLPSSLSIHLASQSPRTGATVPSTDAPKLLTRQIKSSTFYLQKQLLYALLSHFTNENKLLAEARLAVALIVAFVLELVRNAGRAFARFSSKINEKVVVEERQVTEYERGMEGVVFNTVRASVSSYGGGVNRRMGGLGERLRSLGLKMKGKGKEDEECRLVSVILNLVL
jgi:hypothetical protein